MSSALHDTMSAAPTYHGLKTVMGSKFFQRMPVEQHGNTYSQLTACALPNNQVLTVTHVIDFNHDTPSNSARKDVFVLFSKTVPHGSVLDSQYSKNFILMMECSEIEEKQRLHTESLQQEIFFQNRDILDSMDKVMATGLVKRIGLAQLPATCLDSLKLLTPFPEEIQHQMAKGYTSKRSCLVV